jgi:tetratricopeptide (TPR) repeat protein
MNKAVWGAAVLCAAMLVAHAAAQTPAAAQAPATAQTPAVAQTPAADLDALERALQAQPDDLKAGDDYRTAVIQSGQYDRAITYFGKLVAANPNASNLHLNYGFEYVDKIPAAGAITQVILANNALGEFTRSLEIKPSWIGYYTRGNSYLFWPRIFNRTHLGVDDLQEALKIQKSGPKHAYYVRVYIALGDGHWKMDDFDGASKTWRAGLEEFPDNAVLKSRLSSQGDALKAMIDDAYDSNKRVDTSLRDLWSGQ